MKNINWKKCPQIGLKYLKDKKKVKLARAFQPNGQDTFLIIFQNQKYSLLILPTI